KMGVGIIGVGHYAPDNIVTNTDLEKIVDTTDEWIRTRTGIEERRIAKDDEDSSDMAFIAAERALKSAGKTADEIDLILVATVTPDTPFPSVACMIQDRLGATNAAAMDLGAACAGCRYGVITGQQFIEDGAGAAVLSNVSEGNGILSFELGANGKGGPHLLQKDDGFLYMNGREVFKFAVRQMPESCINVVEKAGLRKEDVDYLVPHQANIRIMEAARQRIGIDEDKMATTIKYYGNNSSASIPIALSQSIEDGKIKDGDVIVLVGFGG